MIARLDLALDSAPGADASNAGARRRKTIALSLIVAVHFLFGLSHIAFLPPWEGFDEPAHYSSIQQIADLGSIPRLGRARLSQDVETYRRQAPTRYGHPHEGMPVHPKSLTYSEFFAGDAALRDAGRRAVHEPPAAPRRFRQSEESNWQAQHPPLFYLLMAPLQSLTKDWSLGAQLFLLRSVSYLPAVGALAIMSLVLSMTAGPGFAFAVVAAWPVLFPTWFPEMARLGNDGLCALLVAVVWLVLIGRLGGHRIRARYVLVGFILGAGLLTKGYFVPISIGVLAYLLFRDRSPWILVAAGIACVMGSWWYAWNWIDLGNPTGFVEFQLERIQADGVVAQFFRNITWELAFKGPIGFVRSFAWSGTWSFALPGTLMLAGITAIPVMIVILFGDLFCRLKSVPANWLPLWVLLPVLVGFAAHFVIKVAETTAVVAPTPGWYMHVLLVPLGAVMGAVVRVYWPWPWFRVMAAVAAAYATAFSVYVAWQQILLFAGFVGRTADRATYAVIGPIPTPLQADAVFVRLEFLAYPAWGTAFFVLAVVGLVAAVILFVVRERSRLRR